MKRIYDRFSLHDKYTRLRISVKKHFKKADNHAHGNVYEMRLANKSMLYIGKLIHECFFSRLKLRTRLAKIT